MTITAAIQPSDWCFDFIDITPLVPRRRNPAQATNGDGELTPHTLLEIIFGELRHETDRPIRDRLNEALRQWRLSRLANKKPT